MPTPTKPPIEPLLEAHRGADYLHSPRVERLSTRVLLGGRREIEIEHNSAIYRLRVTSSGKLILTK